MASVRPRELLGLPLPQIEVGAEAELVLFEWGPDQPLMVNGTPHSLA